MFYILPTSICTTIMKKKNIYIYCMSIQFFFLYYKCIFIKIYLCTKKGFLFIFSFLRDVSPLQLHSVCSSPCFSHVTLLVYSKTATSDHAFYCFVVLLRRSRATLISDRSHRLLWSFLEATWDIYWTGMKYIYEKKRENISMLPWQTHRNVKPLVIKSTSL